MALFGEKYPDIVRVVQMGDYSRELCGGTHLDNAGQVGLFKVMGEESVASGTRRITALVGKAALDYVREEEEILGIISIAVEGSLSPDRGTGEQPDRRGEDAQEASVATAGGEPVTRDGRRLAGR